MGRDRGGHAGAADQARASPGGGRAARLRGLARRRWAAAGERLMATRDLTPLGPGELCLGIDIGTNGARMIAVDAAGSAVACAVQPMPAPERSGNRAEQDPAIWWQAVLRAFTLLKGEIDLTRIRR